VCAKRGEGQKILNYDLPNVLTMKAYDETFELVRTICKKNYMLLS